MIVFDVFVSNPKEPPLLHFTKAEDSASWSVCPRCDGRGWLCEAHPDKPFEHDDCPGPGDPCPLCNELARDYRG